MVLSRISHCDNEIMLVMGHWRSRRGERWGLLDPISSGDLLVQQSNISIDLTPDLQRQKTQATILPGHLRLKHLERRILADMVVGVEARIGREELPHETPLVVESILVHPGFGSTCSRPDIHATSRRRRPHVNVEITKAAGTCCSVVGCCRAAEDAEVDEVKGVLDEGEFSELGGGGCCWCWVWDWRVDADAFLDVEGARDDGDDEALEGCWSCHVDLTWADLGRRSKSRAL